jgi:hypothetical protein
MNPLPFPSRQPAPVRTSSKQANAAAVRLLSQTIERVTRRLPAEDRNLVLLALSAAISATLEALESDTSY